jgi:hypothetical protein
LLLANAIHLKPQPFSEPMAENGLMNGLFGCSGGGRRKNSVHFFGHVFFGSEWFGWSSPSSFFRALFTLVRWGPDDHGYLHKIPMVFLLILPVLNSEYVYLDYAICIGSPEKDNLSGIEANSRQNL